MAKSNIYTYDTKEIRQEARKILACCDHIENSALPRVKSAVSHLDGNFEGCAAEALDECLEEARKQLNKLNEGLGSFYMALWRYAEALEEADRQAAELMK